MRIALLAEVSAASVIGGAERVLREQAMGLSERGHKVHLVVRTPTPDAAPQATIGATIEHRFQVDRRTAPAFVRSTVNHSAALFGKLAEKAPFDAVMVHQSLAGLGPILRCRRLGKRWIYVCLSHAHEEYLTRNEPTAGRQISHRLNALARLWIERFVLRRCGRVLVLSEFMRERVVRFHRVAPERIMLIPGAADTRVFTPAAGLDASRAQLRLPRNQFLLFTVRNLVPRMGLDNLVLAMQQVAAAFPDVVLCIGGSGPLRDQLQNLITSLQLESRIRLLGFVPENTLPDWYRAADLVVMPTHLLEGFGLVTVEAMACGTPVLGTPVAAIPEVLRPLDPGLIADDSTPDAIARALISIVTRFKADPAARAKLSRKCLDAVRLKYNWNAHCDALANLLLA